jgi:hypothetical protein
MQRGKLPATPIGLSVNPRNLQQDWQFDGTDNWGSHAQSVSAPSWGWQSQSQQRTHDDGNRLTNLQRTGNEVKQVRIDGTPPTSESLRAKDFARNSSGLDKRGNIIAKRFRKSITFVARA